MSKIFLTPDKNGNIRVAQILEKFMHRDIAFIIHVNEDGLYCVAHHLSGYAAHVESDYDACKNMAIKKIDKALDDNFDFEKYNKINTPKNVKSIQEFIAVCDTIREEIKDNNYIDYTKYLININEDVEL